MRPIAAVAGLLAALGIATGSTAGGFSTGTSSTPGTFTLPQVGTFSFRCATRAFAVQPVFDTKGSPTEEMVTMRAGRVVRRNYRTMVVRGPSGRRLTETRFAPGGARLALPFGHYRTVTVTAHQGTEARAIDTRLAVTFVDGPGRGCYVTTWKVTMDVRPF